MGGGSYKSINAVETTGCGKYTLETRSRFLHIHRPAEKHIEYVPIVELVITGA